VISAAVLIDGAAEGPILKIAEPLSFWGGVDPATARVSDPRHPQHGACLTGRIVALTQTRGSSSSSAIMLELLYRRIAPAALILSSPDAILALGVLVAREMGYPTIPVLTLPAHRQAELPDDGRMRIEAGGRLSLY
jgi:predicted aconitase with swiveling domain